MPRTMRTHTKEEIIAAIKECAQELGHAPSISKLQKMKGVLKGTIYNRFGNYRAALAACGLERSGPSYLTDTRLLFLDWATVARTLGKVPSMGDYEARAKYSIQPLLRRYGNWGEVPAAMADYARVQGLEAEWADVIEMIARRQSSVRSLAQRPVQRLVRPPGFLSQTHLAPAILSPASLKPVCLKEDQPVYGAPLTISPLTFAPTHEGGVIFLFGTVAEELGLAVLRIQPSFPDCEAMREVRPGQWQRVRIEFEFESRNFLSHGHPVAGCDLIVCWNHNWEDCPLEVVELRKLIGKGVSPQIYADERR